MADDWRNQRDSFGTLRVPFVFIPEGATAPTDWLTDHPNHIRVPATFVPSRRSRELPEHQRDRSSPVVAPSGDTAPAAANGSFAPVGVRGRRRWPPPPEIDRSGYLREGPVVAYLRANDVFVRMGAVKPDTRHRKAGGTVPLPTAINDQPVQPVYPLEYGIGTAAGGGVLCRPDGVIIRQVLPSLQCTHAPDLIASLSSTDLAASRSNSRTCVQLAANNTNVATDVSPGDNNVQTVANEGTPGSNQAQNAQVRAVVRILGLTRDQQQLHREIAGQDYGFQEILETAKDMFGK